VSGEKVTAELLQHAEWTDERLPVRVVMLRAADRISRLEKSLADLCNDIMNGTRDYTKHGMGETLPVDYPLPPSAAKQLRARVEAAREALGETKAEGGRDEDR